MLLIASLASGCTSHGPAEQVKIDVTPAQALLDTPLAVKVTGLQPGEHATLSASALDAEGVTWRSSATFAASSAGTVTTTRRPLSGSYDDADPMGLIDRMRPTRSGPDESLFYPAGPSYRVSIAVTVGGKRVAHTDVERLDPVSVGVEMRGYRPPTSPLYADLYLPKQHEHRRPAVLVFGGSEGGLSGSFEASLLAAHGYPAMSLAYFGARGLAQKLRNIPLEYFVKALHVLRDAPGVDPRHLLVWGVSRGSEAALLLGAHFPNLVHGVIGGVPSSVANVMPNGSRPAWTLSGHPVPYAPRRDYGYPQPASGRGIIPVERINGPILLICGAADMLWPSCGYSDAIVARLDTHGLGDQVTELEYATAGHGVGGELPYVPTASADYAPGEHLGGTVAGDVLGRIDAWRHILSLLTSLR
jgi:pimeloyl-ACP methyl ester carboxylesterase